MRGKVSSRTTRSPVIVCKINKDEIIILATPVFHGLNLPHAERSDPLRKIPSANIMAAKVQFL